jgi:hypothetical protein
MHCGVLQVLCPLLKRFQPAPQLVDAMHGSTSAPVAAAEQSSASASSNVNNNTGINGSLHRRRLSTSHHHVRRVTTGVNGDVPAADTEPDTTVSGGDAVDNSDVTVNYDEELPAILRAQHDIYNFGRPVMGGGSWVSHLANYIYKIYCTLIHNVLSVIVVSLQMWSLQYCSDAVMIGAVLPCNCSSTYTV